MWPDKWNIEQIIAHGLAEILTNQGKILERTATILSNQEREMAAIDDLNTAVSTLQTDVAALIAKGGTPDAAIAAVTANVVAIDTAVKAAIAPPTPSPAA